MKVYKDIFTKDELFTDECEIQTIDDIVYKISAKNVNRVTRLDGAVFGGDGGGDGSGPGTEEIVESGLELVVDYNLQSFSMDLKDYKVTLRDYLKRIKERLQEKNPDRVDPFMKAATKFFTEFIIPNYNDMELFTGDSGDYTAMIVLCHTKDGVSNFYYWLDGAFGEKY